MGMRSPPSSQIGFLAGEGPGVGESLAGATLAELEASLRAPKTRPKHAPTDGSRLLGRSLGQPLNGPSRRTRGTAHCVIELRDAKGE